MLRTKLYLTLLLAFPFISEAAPPSVYIDSLSQGQAIGGSVIVAGWAIDNTTVAGTPIAFVQIAVDGTTVGAATYGTVRGDVCGPYPNRPGCPNVGFTYALNTTSLTNGAHTITATATDTDSPPDSGSFSVTVNVSNGPPSVFIDSLSQGQTISGTVTVAGWAIDNTTVPITPIGSVQIKVDGITAGSATYGVQRLDVCAVYPGRPNCPNVGFTFQLNTTKLSAGTHTITAVAFDTDPFPESASFSVTVQVRVGTIPTTTTIASPQSPSNYLSSLKLSATVTPGTGVGAVAFEDGGVILGTVTPSAAGQVSLSTSQLGSGTRSLRAFFSGSSTLSPSASAALTQTVNAQSSNGFAPPVTSSLGNPNRPTSFAIADFNSDGKPDIVAAAGLPIVILGRGNGSFQSPVTISTTTQANFVAVADFNGDGKPDLVIGAPNGGAVFLGNGDGTFQLTSQYILSNQVSSLVVGDFNVDGKPDFAVSNNNSLTVYLGNGDGTFQSALNSASEAQVTSLAVADFNADGIPDIAAIGSNDVDIFIGNGDGTFAPLISYADSLTPSALAVADINGDGRADIAVTNSSGSVAIFLNNGDGTFKNSGNYSSGFLPNSIAVGDINGDGKTDLVVCNGFGGVLILLPGNGDGTFGSGSIVATGAGSSSGSQYSQVLVGDFNGDGHADLLALGHSSLLQSPAFVDTYLSVSITPPTVYIDSLAAGATVFGTVTVSGWAIDPATAISSVQIKVDGAVLGTAIYGISRGDVCGVYPGRPGCPNVGFTYQLNTTSLNPGTHTITAVATDLNPTPLTASYSVTVTVPQVAPPTVVIDSLASGATVTGVVTVSGWAIDPATPIGGVQVKIDGIAVGTAAYGSVRADICASHPGSPGCPSVGFTYQLNTAALPPGNHTLTVVATNTDPIPLSTSFSIPITIVSVPPTVFIDGTNVSGNTATINGWAIDSTTPISAIQIQVDGNSIGNATYGYVRNDVCVVYPGRPSCPNVGFSIQFNTAAYAHGPHTITAIATDSDIVPDSSSYSVTIQF
jgi:hypothetical protein